MHLRDLDVSSCWSPGPSDPQMDLGPQGLPPWSFLFAPTLPSSTSPPSCLALPFLPKAAHQPFPLFTPGVPRVRHPLLPEPQQAPEPWVASGRTC